MVRLIPSHCIAHNLQYDGKIHETAKKCLMTCVYLMGTLLGTLHACVSCGLLFHSVWNNNRQEQCKAHQSTEHPVLVSHTPASLNINLSVGITSNCHDEDNEETAHGVQGVVYNLQYSGLLTLF